MIASPLMHPYTMHGDSYQVTTDGSYGIDYSRAYTCIHIDTRVLCISLNITDVG